MTTEIDAQIREIQSRKKEVHNGNSETAAERIGLGESGYYDRDIYDGAGPGKFEGYVTSIATTDDADVSKEIMNGTYCRKTVLLILNMFVGG